MPSSSFCMTRRVFPGCFGSVSVIWRKGKGSHAKARRREGFCIGNSKKTSFFFAASLLRVRFLIL
jgi:hypothetical protein